MSVDQSHEADGHTTSGHDGAHETASPARSVRPFFRVMSILAAIGVSMVFAEGIVRFRNRAMDNYQVEMWRYSNELKRASENPVLGHEHIPDRTAVLQGVEIKLNDRGMRCADVAEWEPGTRRILLLGSSITLGWGVPEDDTLAVRLAEFFQRDGTHVEILNAGVGNYNTVRYVELFLSRLTDLHPTDIVVHYFLNDAEVLSAGGGNALLRNSQLAAVLWTRLLQQNAGTGLGGLREHYAKVYLDDAPGYSAMKESLRRLSEYARDHGVRLYLAMTPDVHNLENYQFGFIHEKMQGVAERLGYHYVDLYPGMRHLAADDIWTIPGDPHPNGLGHQIMAETLYPALIQRPDLATTDPDLHRHPS